MPERARGIVSAQMLHGVEHLPTGLTYGVWRGVVRYGGLPPVPVAARLPAPTRQQVEDALDAVRGLAGA